MICKKKENGWTPLIGWERPVPTKSVIVICVTKMGIIEWMKKQVMLKRNQRKPSDFLKKKKMNEHL